MPARSMCRRNSWPKPDALVGAFDQARNVGHDERAVEIDLHPAEVGCLVVNG